MLVPQCIELKVSVSEWFKADRVPYWRVEGLLTLACETADDATWLSRRMAGVGPIPLDCNARTIPYMSACEHRGMFYREKLCLKVFKLC